MTEIDELLDFRVNILDDSRDDNGFLTQTNLLTEVMPSLLDSKLVDSEDFQEAHYLDEEEKLKINAYMINGSTERLQVFIVDENLFKEKVEDDDLLISQRSTYSNQFKRVEKILRKSFKGQFSDTLQESSPEKAFATLLESMKGIEQIDVIEIFLISMSITTSFRGKVPQPNRIYFKDEKIKRTYTHKNLKCEKEIVLSRKLVDVNYLFDVMVSKGHREVLTIDFEKTFDYSIEAIKAADEEKFESYLCVLNASVLADLYRQYSSRLLEKNVRSFLDFRGVNKGIKETIRKEPEKFIAYNNGLTITATEVKTYEKKKKLYIKSLTDFQIVNGGQTTATIYFSQKDGLPVDKVKIMAKINIAKKTDSKDLDTLINNISQYSNAQSKVSKVDLNSRDPQLIKIKQLSESIQTPSDTKWFFERSKGEFNTLLRKASNKKKERDKYPTKIRFTKEQLAKYYCSWGDEPYMVKKGGERIFRHFMEHLNPDDDSGVEPPNIDRDYYENLISKIILFRKMETLHGTRSKAIGQIRSAVIPYTLSILYTNTDLKGNIFNMEKIWKYEGLEDDLSQFLYDLMVLVNDLIKKYSLSDDLGEYSKKVELWNNIKSSEEIKLFISSNKVLKILEKYKKDN